MKKKHWCKVLAVLLFLGYGALMIYLLFFRNRTATDGLTYWEQVNRNYNLTIWHTIGNFWDILVRREYYMGKWEADVYYNHARIAIINLVGNVVMFVPLGVFIPTIWTHLQRLWKVMPIGFGCILAVEICQLFTLRGKCDVDDLLLNMLGIALGYISWRLVRTYRRKRK